VGVVEASVRELQCTLHPFGYSFTHSSRTRADHCSILQLMGMGKDSVMIIHMGV